METNFRGEGSTVAAITTRPNPDVAGEISGTFTAEISVPANVAAGSNQVVIEGRSASGTTTQLPLDVITEEQQPGAVTFVADFPSLEAPRPRPSASA